MGEKKTHHTRGWKLASLVDSRRNHDIASILCIHHHRSWRSHSLQPGTTQHSWSNHTSYHLVLAHTSSQQELSHWPRDKCRFPLHMSIWWYSKSIWPERPVPATPSYQYLKWYIWNISLKEFIHHSIVICQCCNNMFAIWTLTDGRFVQINLASSYKHE